MSGLKIIKKLKPIPTNNCKSKNKIESFQFKLFFYLLLLFFNCFKQKTSIYLCLSNYWKNKINQFSLGGWRDSIFFLFDINFILSLVLLINCWCLIADSLGVITNCTDFDIKSLSWELYMFLEDLKPYKESLEPTFIDSWDWFLIEISDPYLDPSPITS